MFDCQCVGMLFRCSSVISSRVCCLQLVWLVCSVQLLMLLSVEYLCVLVYGMWLIVVNSLCIILYGCVLFCSIWLENSFSVGVKCICGSCLVRQGFRVGLVGVGCIMVGLIVVCWVKIVIVQWILKWVGCLVIVLVLRQVVCCWVWVGVMCVLFGLLFSYCICFCWLGILCGYGIYVWIVLLVGIILVFIVSDWVNLQCCGSIDVWLFCLDVVIMFVWWVLSILLGFGGGIGVFVWWCVCVLLLSRNRFDGVCLKY